MDPLLEVLLGKFNLSDDVVLTIDKNGKKAYLRGVIAAVQEKYLLISTKGSIVKIAPESIIQITKPQSGNTKQSSQKSTKANSNSTTTKTDKNNSSQQTKNTDSTANKPVLSNKLLKSTSNEPIRLNQFFVNLGLCSRSEAEELILAGRVTINGMVSTEPGTKIQKGDEVRIHEKPIDTRKNEHKKAPLSITTPITKSTETGFVEETTPSAKLDISPGLTKVSIKQDSPKPHSTTTSGSVKKASPNPGLVEKKVPFPKFGDIFSIEETTVGIRTVKGEIISIPKDRIIDKTVIKEVNEHYINKTISDIPVTWAKFNDEIICVLGIMTEEKINSRVNTSADMGNYEQAIALAELLQHFCPSVHNENRIAKLKKELGVTDTAEGLQATKEESNDVDKLLEEGNLDEAAKVLKNQYDKGDIIKKNLPSQLVMQYSLIGQFEKAYEILEYFHFFDFPQDFFPNTKKNVNWLCSRLKNIGHLDKYIETQYSRLQTATTDNQKVSCYKELAWAFLNLDDKNIAEAEKYYKLILGIDPQNKDAKAALAEISQDVVVDVGFKDLNPSLIVADTLNTRLDVTYSREQKEELKTYSKHLGLNSYKERAETFRKIACISNEIYERDDAIIYLSKYLNERALYAHKDKRYDEATVRFLLCESIALRKKDDNRMDRYAVFDSIALYLSLYYKQNENLFFQRPKMFPLLESAVLESDERFYPDLISLMLYKIPFSRLVSKLWESRYQTSSLSFLDKNGVKPAVLTEEAFRQSFQKLVDERRKQIEEMTQLFADMKNEDTYTGMIARFESFNEEALTEEIDRTRYQFVKDMVFDKLRSYFEQPDPSKKSYTIKDCRNLLKDTIIEYSEEPTRFSYDCLVFMLKHFLKMMEEDFDNTIKGTMPVLSIQSVGDCFIQDDVLSFQLQISNEKGRSYITKYHVRVECSESVVEHIKGDSISYNQLSGGESITIPQQIRICVGNGADAVPITVSLSYETIAGNSIPFTLTQQLSLHLANDDLPEDNPYADFSAGNPVTKEDMFFGRADLISNLSKSLIVEGVNKQVLIYGQRRSGKTSILNKLKTVLESQNAFCILFSFESLTISDSGSADLFAAILNEIATALYKAGWTTADYKYAARNHLDLIFDDYDGCPEIMIASRFINDLEELNGAFKAKEGWGNRKMILMIDEFTSLYSQINEGNLPKTIMQVWKSVFENRNVNCSVVLIGQDNTPKFKSEPWASNPFAAIEDQRISYLPEDDAMKMVVWPIRDKNQKSRYVGKAVQRVLDYTAGSPFYLMIFLNSLVVYMKDRKKIGKVTEVDIDEIAQMCIKEKLTDTQFNNLYTAVTSKKEEEIRNKNLLRVIAVGMEESSDKDGVSADYIYSKSKGICEQEIIDDILADFVTREVLVKRNNCYRIKVILFQKWLLQN